MRRSITRWILVCLIAACSAGQGPPVPTLPDDRRTSAPVGTPAPSPSSDDAAPTGGPAAGESRESPERSERPTEGVLPLPPEAKLTLSGVEHAGERGSFCYGGMCGDAPFPSPASLASVRLRTAHQELRITLGDGSRFGWAAAISRTSDETGERQTLLGASGTSEGPVREASFRGPPSGSWVLQLSIDFDDELGSANHYWRLEVP